MTKINIYDCTLSRPHFKTLEYDANHGKYYNHHVQLVPLVIEIARHAQCQYFHKHFDNEDKCEEPIRVHENVVNDFWL